MSSQSSEDLSICAFENCSNSVSELVFVVVALVVQQITQELPEVQEFLQLEAAPQACSISFPRLEGIEWDASPANAFPSCAVGSLLPAWASLVVYRASPLASRHNSFTDWDPLLKLRIRDAVLSDGYFARSDITLPLAPVAIPGSTSGATLKDDVVRVWDCDSKTLMKSVHLLEGGYGARAPVSAFDVNWESKVAAMSREGGVLSFANLECGVYEKFYQTQQSVVQAIHLDRASSPNTVFTGLFSAIASPSCQLILLAEYEFLNPRAKRMRAFSKPGFFLELADGLKMLPASVLHAFQRMFLSF